jgi:3-(3-hydroxy-phenyl)propionate hydroxylase
VSSKMLQDFDVAIVGLGPTGLTLAHFLGRRGLKVIALEREPEFYGNARAVYTDDECMRIFQEAGVAVELEADMIVDCPVQWVLEDGSVLGQLRRFDRPYGWTMSNFLYQPYFETKLESLLTRYANVQIMRGRELIAFEQNSDWVTFQHGASKGVQYGRAPAQAADSNDVASARALAGCLRRWTQRGTHSTRHQNGRQELPRTLAGRGHQIQEWRRLFSSFALLQFPLRS